MKTNNRITNLFIISPNYFFRLGIRTALNLIEENLNVIEEVNLCQCADKIDEFNSGDVRIIADVSAVTLDGMSILRTWASSKLKDSILVVGDNIPDLPSGVACIENLDTRNIIIQKLQHLIHPPQKEEPKRDNDQGLTDREVDILKAVAQGFANKEIAEQLFISINTVITHRKRITEKLGIKTIAGLTVYAMMNDIIQPDDVH